MKCVSHSGMNRLLCGVLAFGAVSLFGQPAPANRRNVPNQGQRMPGPQNTQHQNSQNPFLKLTSGQREHFEIYWERFELQRSKARFDRRAMAFRIAKPIKEGCQNVIEKFRFEAMKAGDKAKETRNDKMREQMETIRDAYTLLYESCRDIIKAVDRGDLKIIDACERQYSAQERVLRDNRIELPKRNWLTYEEAENLIIFKVASKGDPRKQEHKEEPKPPHKNEPKVQPQPHKHEQKVQPQPHKPEQKVQPPKEDNKKRTNPTRKEKNKKGRK